MDTKQYKILILEDVPSDAELVVRELQKGGLQFESKLVMDQEGFSRELDVFAPDLILSDYHLPQFSGLQALEMTKAKYPDLPFIFVSGTIGEESAIETLRLGATDYVLKDKLVQLMPVIERAFRDVETKNKLQEKTLSLEKLVNSMVGREIKMAELKEAIAGLKGEVIVPKKEK